MPQDDDHNANCEQRAECLIRHLEALLIAISNLTRAKMASYIPEELTVDEIKRLMVSPSDSKMATPLKSPDADGIDYPEGRYKELPDDRIEQLDKECQDVIGAEYERRKYSIFLDANLPKSDCLSVTLTGNEDFYEVVVRTITDLANQGLPISTRLKAVLAETRYGLTICRVWHHSKSC